MSDENIWIAGPWQHFPRTVLVLARDENGNPFYIPYILREVRPIVIGEDLFAFDPLRIEEIDELWRVGNIFDFESLYGRTLEEELRAREMELEQAQEMWDAVEWQFEEFAAAGGETMGFQFDEVAVYDEEDQEEFDYSEESDEEFDLPDPVYHSNLHGSPEPPNDSRTEETSHENSDLDRESTAGSNSLSKRPTSERDTAKVESKETLVDGEGNPAGFGYTGEGLMISGPAYDPNHRDPRTNTKIDEVSHENPSVKQDGEPTAGSNSPIVASTSRENTRVLNP